MKGLGRVAGMGAAVGPLGGLNHVLGSPIRLETQNLAATLLQQASGVQQAQLMQQMQNVYPQRVPLQEWMLGAAPAETEAQKIERELDALCPTLREARTPALSDPWYVRWYVGVLRWLLTVLP